MKVEHVEISKDEVDAETAALMEKMDRCIELLEEFLNVNQFHPGVAMHSFINALPSLAKLQGMSFDVFKSLMIGVLDAYEKKWDSF